MISKKVREAEQRGFTIVELAIVLAIVAIIIAGVFAGVSAANKSMKTNSLKTAIVQAASIVQSASNVAGDYGNGTFDEYLVRSGKVPSAVTVIGAAGSRQLRHQFNGLLTAQGRGHKFVISLSNIPGDICVDLFSSATSERLVVSSAAPNSVSVDSGGSVAPYDKNDAVNSCNEAGNNQMHFIY